MTPVCFAGEGSCQCPGHACQYGRARWRPRRVNLTYRLLYWEHPVQLLGDVTQLRGDVSPLSALRERTLVESTRFKLLKEFLGYLKPSSVLRVSLMVPNFFPPINFARYKLTNNHYSPHSFLGLNCFTFQVIGLLLAETA